MGARGVHRLGRVAVWGLAAMLMCAAAAATRAADMPKADALKQALSEMSSARRALAERGAAAAELRTRLQAHLEELRSEIVQERRQNAVGSFQQAVRVERIGYNLRLAQRLYGYLEGIDRRIDYFRAADHTLEFTLRRTHDELLMVKVLENSEISGVLAQIESLLSEVALETQQPLFNASESPSRTLESLWSEFARSP